MLLLLALLGIEINAVATPNQVQPYSLDLSTYLVDFAGAAYCGGDLGRGVENWSCDACKKHPEVHNVTVISDDETGTTGYVALAYPTNFTREPSIYVVFAGTDPLKIQTWIDDLQYTQVPYQSKGCDKCEIDKGFLKAYTSVAEWVRGNITKYWHMIPDISVRRLFFVGHSLGAAITSLAALDVMKMFEDNELLPQLAATLEVYTYGEPRVGDEHFARFTNKTLNSHYRQVHHYDPVPHLPPEDKIPIIDPYRYRHPAREIFYKHKPKDYTICNGSGEDPKCSDQYIADLNVFDHLNYMNFDFIGNYLSCKLTWPG